MTTDETQQPPAADEPARDALAAEVSALGARRPEHPTRVGDLERRVLQLQTSVTTLSAQNDRLVRTLKDAREQIVTLRSEVDRLAQPPSSFGIIVDVHDDATVDVLTGGRKMRVAVSPSVELADLGEGREVRLNEALNVVQACRYERVGEVVTVKEALDAERLLGVAHADEERVCRIATALRGERIRAGDAVLLDTRSGFVYERVPKAEVEELILEEVPDIAYEDIGGLGPQIDQIRDAVEDQLRHGNTDQYALQQVVRRILGRAAVHADRVPPAGTGAVRRAVGGHPAAPHREPHPSERATPQPSRGPPPAR